MIQELLFLGMKKESNTSAQWSIITTPTQLAQRLADQIENIDTTLLVL